MLGQATTNNLNCSCEQSRGHSLNIVFLMVAVFVVAVLFIFWAIVNDLEKQDKIEMLHELAESLRIDIEMNKTGKKPLWDTNLDRMERVVNILSNSTVDKDVVVYSMCISEKNEDGAVILNLRFLDERDSLAQVNYCESIDTNSNLGDVFATSNMLGTLTTINTEIRTIFIGLKANNNLKNGSEPYSVQDYLDGMFPLFLLPEEMFNKIIMREGQFIFLDKEGNILDRAKLKDFGYGIKQENSKVPDINEVSVETVSLMPLS